MGNFIPVEPEKWAEMVKAAASSDYWRIEAETDHARWIRTLEENEKLRAEVERLKAEVERLTAQVSYDNRTQLHVDKLAAEFTQCEVEKLKAEVEGLKVDVYRLTEAGNNMWAFAHNCVILGVYPKTAQEKIDIWNAAKKGKKS